MGSGWPKVCEQVAVHLFSQLVSQFIFQLVYIRDLGAGFVSQLVHQSEVWFRCYLFSRLFPLFSISFFHFWLVSCLPACPCPVARTLSRIGASIFQLAFRILCELSRLILLRLLRRPSTAQALDRSVPCGSQCSPPDLHRELWISVFPAGPQLKRIWEDT